MNPARKSYRLAGLKIRPELNEIDKNGVCVHVEPILMDILLCLIENAPQPVSADELLRRFWPDTVVEESTIHRRISQLRGVLDDDARNPTFIATVPKRGYRVVAPVEKEAETETEGAAGKDDDIARNSRKIFGRLVALVAVTGLVAATTAAFLYLERRDELPPVAASEEAISAMHSVAVLPFDFMGGSQQHETLAKGLNEEVLDRLAQNEWINVASRTSTESAVERGGNLSEVAEQLNVAYVVEGSVQATTQGTRITAQLIRASDTFHLWSKTYQQEEGGDLLTFQLAAAENVARIVVSELDFDIHRTHGGSDYGSLAGINPRAVELYFAGEDQYRRLLIGEGGDWEVYERLIRQAVAIDPNFFIAVSSLANIYIHRLDGRMPYKEALAKAAAALAAAKAIDSQPIGGVYLQEAQFHLFLAWDYPKARSALEQNLSYFPDCAWCYLFLAEIAVREGRFGESRALLKTAIARSQTVSDEQATLLLSHARLLIALGEHSRAATVLSEALSLTDAGQEKVRILRMLALSHITLGDIDKAKALVDQAWEQDDRVHPEAYVYLFAKTGNESGARELVVDTRFQFRDNGWTAAGHLALGEVDKAVELIRLGLENHNNMLATHLANSSMFTELRTDPRREELLALLRSLGVHTSNSQVR